MMKNPQDKIRVSPAVIARMLGLGGPQLGPGAAQTFQQYLAGETAAGGRTPHMTSPGGAAVVSPIVDMETQDPYGAQNDPRIGTIMHLGHNYPNNEPISVDRNYQAGGVKDPNAPNGGDPYNGMLLGALYRMLAKKGVNIPPSAGI